MDGLITPGQFPVVAFSAGWAGITLFPACGYRPRYPAWSPIGRWSQIQFRIARRQAPEEFGELKVKAMLIGWNRVPDRAFAPDQAHIGLPLLTSKPRITPDVSRVEVIRDQFQHNDNRLSVIIGGDVGSYSPGVVSGILVCEFRTPLL